MEEKPFEPEFSTNINKIYLEFTSQLKIILKTTPWKTAHRQNLPVWYSSSTSYLVKKVHTLRKLWKEKPTSYRKTELIQTEQQLLNEAEKTKLTSKTGFSSREILV